MGVKDLWNILTPLGDRKPLYELQGKTVAIDLSCWVVDSQNIVDNMIQPKMHVRNLFFRTSNFLLQDIFPVFVLEGTAPALKHNTIAKRNDIRQGREEKKTSKKGGRTRFNHILKECEQMLAHMGISCIRGAGEAEAMCAYLNADGLVDGCISQDSDCFLYGAKIVYRNFSTTTQGTKATSGGSIDEYNIEKIQNVLNIGRNKMIALALICGCDYDEGLSGVGKEAALKLFKIVEDGEILNRMKSWKSDPMFDRIEKEWSNPNVCTNCGHDGVMRNHTRVGCVDCGTSTKCNSNYKEQKMLVSNELSIRKKSLLNNSFPNQELIDEFLIRKESVPSELDLKWKKPKIVQFVEFMERVLQWEQIYAFQKIFPLMTRWQLLNLTKLPLEQRLTASNVFVPEKIKKTKCPRGVASYEILWIDKNDILKGLNLTSTSLDNENRNKDEDEENLNVSSELSTTEPQDLVNACYPNIVEDFEAMKNAKKKKPVRSRKKKVDENVEEPIEKKKPERKRRGKSKPVEVEKNRKILEFINLKKCNPTLEESFEKMTITPKRRKKTVPENIPSVKKRGPQINRVMTVDQLDSILNGSLEVMFNQLTPEDFTSDVEDPEEMSIIIDEICGIERKCRSKPEEKNHKDILIEYRHTRNIATDVNEANDDVSVVYGDLSENIEGDLKNLQLKNKINDEVSLIDTPRKLNPMDISIEYQSTPLKEVEKDEFDLLDQTYVPLDVRLGQNDDEKELNRSIRTSEFELKKSRFSIGIESLLNGTD